MDILDDMGVSKLSAKVFSKVNYSFKAVTHQADLKELYWRSQKLNAQMSTNTCALRLCIRKQLSISAGISSPCSSFKKLGSLFVQLNGVYFPYH